MPRLVFPSGEVAGGSFELPEGEVSVGRSELNHVIFGLPPAGWLLAR